MSERGGREGKKLPNEMESNGKSGSTRRGEKLVEHQLPRLDGMLLMGSERYTEKKKSGSGTNSEKQSLGEREG